MGERQRTWRELGVSNLFLYFIILVALFVLSIWFLYVGLNYYTRGEFETAAMMILAGFFGSGLSLLVLRRLRRRMILLQPPVLNVVTVEQCDKCGFKNMKKFERGDYVFKKTDKCPKCGELTTITSIYFEGLGKKGH